MLPRAERIPGKLRQPVPAKTAVESTEFEIPRSRPDKVGTLIMIGGAEDKTGSRAILSEVARRVDGGKLVIATLASEAPAYQWETYSAVFRDLGAADIHHLSAETREELSAEKAMDTLKDTTAVFFTGGDQ